jgi:hypothetical protein
MQMISNEDEFQKLMAEVDAEMVADGIPVHGRQIVAGSKVAKKLGIEFPMGGFGLVSRPPMEGVYSGYELALRILKWVEELYGEKLKIDFDMGVLTIQIFGDFYMMRLPMGYGTVAVVIDPVTMGAKGNPGRINILDLIVDLTPTLASRLTSKDFDVIGALFRLGMKVFDNINTYSADELLSKAHSDLKASTFHLLHRPPEAGLSKWASLQAVEKILKAFIAQRGGCYPTGGKGHELEHLAEIAEKQGLPSLERIHLKKVQCQAGVRYGNVGATSKDALDAQHAALRICHQALTHYTGGG